MKCGLRNSDCGLKVRSTAAQPFRNPQSAIRNSPPSGMTLIELLVVIVILTTLVAGVIPVLSPNNDVRKIRAAGRGLQSYITLAQARAARTGRPQGIGFRESLPESGVALEVFGWEVPPPFAGFSTESRVTVGLPLVGLPPMPIPYNAGFFPQFDGFPLYQLELRLADGAGTFDPIPPHTFRIGDALDIGGNQFLIIDTPFNVGNLFPPAPGPDEIQYLGSAASPVVNVHAIECVWINDSGQTLAPGLKKYKFKRQPATSSESPYQLPSGIVLDMQASVAEGGATGGFPIDESFYTDRTGLPVGATRPTDTVGIMFSPTGAVDSLYFNGNEIANASRIVLLLGRIENGGLDPTLATPSWVVTNPNDKNEVEKKQEEINWLNLDSRLLSIVTSSGRAVVSEMAFVNLGDGSDEDGDMVTIDQDVDDQLEAAHAFAHEMTTAK